MKPVYIVVIVALIALVAIVGMNMRHEPTAGERIGNAIDEMTDGMENAGEELQDRSPLEKMGDAVEDAGEEMQEKAR